MEQTITKKKKTTAQLISELKKRVSELEGNLKAHIQEATTEIMVKEADGSWGDWTGTFYVTNEEKLLSALAKAEDHLQNYFAKGYEEKEFAIFQSVGGVRSIYKIISKSSQ